MSSLSEDIPFSFKSLLLGILFFIVGAFIVYFYTRVTSKAPSVIKVETPLPPPIEE